MLLSLTFLFSKLVGWFCKRFFSKATEGFNFVERPDKESSDVFLLRWKASE